ncbi:putative cell wall biogenesis protein Mhp1 [Rosellinia necatrix]|uniref:Putative cell wall biogenesis protein Mhp1 n=1 Tax=Rosellinia necatrix TaxID=77044 RepID=A0A1S7UN03_ROSNE|nr:putative cell wall biogenesis protein Mhp1 [Rosellinia necatrix]
MEQVLDVSWMTHGKDILHRNGHSLTSPSQSDHSISSSTQHVDSAAVGKTKPNGTSTVRPPSPPPAAEALQPNSSSAQTSTPAPAPAPAKPIPQRGGRARSSSNEPPSGQNGTPPQRRSSWFSNISSKFSGSPLSAQSQVASPPPKPDNNTDDVTPLPKITPNKNAVLPHAARPTGDAPYIPAPPKSAQPGLLGVFRRLSSSNTGTNLGTRASHGLVERRVLNVDKTRERCQLNELNQAKLRRVSFCVDVEIAPMPKFASGDASSKTGTERSDKLKTAEKGDGPAQREPKAIEEQKEGASTAKNDGESSSNGSGGDGAATTNGQNVDSPPEPAKEPKSEKEISRKKEKKKKSEAERRAKKEQKRKEALEKGAIPMEIHIDSDSSTEDKCAPAESPRRQLTPTTNPGRIYRRCCQLRETDILTKVTGQLPKSTEGCPDGIIEKLDLTGYYLSLPDLVTLGDFLAVVPFREVYLENCDLTDEGIRVVLAGLLAARKPNIKRRRSIIKPEDLAPRGGVVERLVLKNNKIGIEGWRHICLFIYMCRSIKYLDLSSLRFPTVLEPAKSHLGHLGHFSHLGHHENGAPAQLDVATLLSKSLAGRLAGPELELLNLGATGLTSSQLECIVDGMLKSGVSRLGLSHNNLDAVGVEHVARYLRNTRCEGLDLGGNDLRDHLEILADAIGSNDALWALSLANCNLNSASLCKLFPKLLKLTNFKFFDLSHNHSLFDSKPNAISLLRRYLPHLDSLRRLHLADVSLSSEQVIALAEILPEVKSLAHINLLENPDLARLADARTEDVQEEACALYASLLAAVRVSKTLVKIDIDNPSSESGELLKALANRVVAYTMRNLQGVSDIQDPPAEESTLKLDKYPDVLRHIVGHEEDYPIVTEDDDFELAPDEDYVIGGTGVAKALACVLKNRGNDVGRQSGEFPREFEDGIGVIRPQLPSGKAMDMSKHLLATARKIRARLQPALASAKASAKEDMGNYHRLVFLDQTIEGIIDRFEDEFPDTRQSDGSNDIASGPSSTAPEPNASPEPHEVDAFALSDTEDVETELRPPIRSRSSSIISHTSRAFSEEEGRALRVGHKFRRSFMSQKQFNMLNSDEEISKNPHHVKLVTSLMEDLMEDYEDIRRQVETKGIVRAFEEDKNNIWKLLRDKDPQYWNVFLESQEKARANIKVEPNGTKIDPAHESAVVDEESVTD